IAVMGGFWAFELLPIAVTALLPLFLFPLLGIMPAQAVSQSYFQDKNVLFFGGLVVAAALECVRAHERIALTTLLLFGTRPRQLLLGFMAATAFLSMWMNNTATTAMMMPIAEAVLSSLEETAGACEGSGRASGRRALRESLGKALMLGVAWSANIGGMGTLTGTGPNIVLAGGFATMFPEAPALSFAAWLAFATRLARSSSRAVICLLVAWALLSVRHLPSSDAGYNAKATYALLVEKRRSLGPLSWREAAAAVLSDFSLLALLWVTRQPGFVPGWGSWFDGYATDGTTAALMATLLFALPASPPSTSACCKGLASRMPAAGRRRARLADWPEIEARVPWGVLLLLGGGFALADACRVSGLSDLLSEHLDPLASLPPPLVVLALMALASLATAFASNVATASILLPVVGALAVSQGCHPLLYMAPVVLAVSLAFSLPVSTPPNALAFASGRLSVRDMAPLGALLNVACCAVVFLFLFTTGEVIFGLGSQPAWAA
ncbi:hypothetical protein EMIHUDRAFT_41435, partial [Emiliania huxleyi CCMP1516]|uniref:Citrate transporter-like domain-containing protein n=2 Tax=Emiliania huxleyi TaxID=2903 RepID=A0A0D3IK80_EMIH1